MISYYLIQCSECKETVKLPKKDFPLPIRKPTIECIEHNTEQCYDCDSTPCICRTKPPLELFSPELDNICSMCGINWLSEGGCVHLYTGEGDD